MSPRKGLGGLAFLRRFRIMVLSLQGGREEQRLWKLGSHLSILVIRATILCGSEITTLSSCDIRAPHPLVIVERRRDSRSRRGSGPERVAPARG